MTGSDKSKTIKGTIVRLGLHVPPKKIVDALGELGIDVSETHVQRIQLQMLRAEAKAANQRAKSPVKDRRKRRPQQRKIPGRRG